MILRNYYKIAVKLHETEGQLNRDLLPIILKLQSHVHWKTSAVLVSPLLKTNGFRTYWRDYTQFCIKNEVACTSRLAVCPPMGCCFNVCLSVMLSAYLWHGLLFWQVSMACLFYLSLPFGPALWREQKILLAVC